MMDTPKRIRLLLRMSRTQGIARRYFITNGFDGALTMLGLIMGFYRASNQVSTAIIINACLGAAIALGISGLSSAYISETAERKKELHDLESAMVTELEDTLHGQANRLAALLIAIVNGLAPVLVALIILTPLWLDESGIHLPLAPLKAAIVCAFFCIFLLGIYIGRISGSFWLWAGLRTVLIALATSILILILTS